MKRSILAALALALSIPFVASADTPDEVKAKVVKFKAVATARGYLDKQLEGGFIVDYMVLEQKNGQLDVAVRFVKGGEFLFIRSPK